MNGLLRGLVFLVSLTLELWIWALLLRFVLQKCKVSYFNPVAQILLRLTEWLVKPTRKYLHLGHWKGLDWALLLWMVVFSCLGVWLLAELTDFMSGVATFGRWQQESGILYFAQVIFQGIVFLAKHVLNLFFFAIIIRAIISWFPQAMSSPLFPALCKVTDPLLNIFKRFIPPLGGMDFSPLFAIIALQLINVVVLSGV